MRPSTLPFLKREHLPNTRASKSESLQLDPWALSKATDSAQLFSEAIQKFKYFITKPNFDKIHKKINLVGFDYVCVCVWKKQLFCMLIQMKQAESCFQRKLISLVIGDQCSLYLDREYNQPCAQFIMSCNFKLYREYMPTKSHIKLIGVWGKVYWLTLQQ